MRLRLVTCAVLWGCSLVAHADGPERVGRTTFALPSQEWVRIAEHEHTLSFDQGQSTMPLYTVMYALPGPKGVPQAMLEVTATDGGRSGRVRWVTEVCPAARPRYFTENFHTDVQSYKRDCLIANSAFAPSSYFAKDDWLLQALQARQWRLFKSGYSLRTTVATQTGSYLRVHLVTQKNFSGRSDAPDAKDLHEVAPELVAWAEALHEEVRSSAYSLSGDLKLPPIAFTTK